MYAAFFRRFRLSGTWSAALVGYSHAREDQQYSQCRSSDRGPALAAPIVRPLDIAQLTSRSNLAEQLAQEEWVCHRKAASPKATMVRVAITADQPKGVSRRGRARFLTRSMRVPNQFEKIEFETIT